MGRFRVLAAAIVCGGGIGASWADELPVLVLRDHRFQPERVDVPPGVKLELRIRNEDASEDEFDSPALHREKDLPPGKEVSVFIGPLRPGSYEFTAELHADTAHGVVVAR